MRKKRTIGILIVVAVLAVGRPVGGQGLSTEEQRIVANVDARLSEAYALLERVVNI